MKRFVTLIGISVLILVGIIIAIVLWFRRSETPGIEPISAIPLESSIIFKIEHFADFSDMLGRNHRFDGIGKIYEFEHIAQAYVQVDSLYRHNSVLKPVLDNSPLYVAICKAGGGNSWVASVRLPTGVTHGDIMDLVKLHTDGLYNNETSQYNQTKISTFRNKNPKLNGFSWAVTSDVLVVSSSKLLIENAVGQIDSKLSLLNNPQFVDIQKIAGKGVVANMFVNYRQLPGIVKAMVNSRYLVGSQTFADLALWTEFDISFNNNNITFSGLSNVADSTNSYLQIFVAQKPVVQTLPDMLPAGTGVFVWLGIADKADYLACYRDYLDRKHELFSYLEVLGEWKKKLGVDADELFNKILQDQVALVFLPSNQVHQPDYQYIVENTNSPSASRDFLLEITQIFIKNTHNSDKNWQSTVQIDRDKRVTMYRFPAQGLHNAVWGSLFPSKLDAFFCFVDNHIVFGESVNALTRFVKDAMRHNTLGKDVNFDRFKAEISKKANFCFYSNPSRSAALIREFTQSPVQQFLISSAQSGLLGLSYQMIGGNSFIFNSFTMTAGTMIRTSTNQTAWVTKLDDCPTMKPQIVLNHNTREREIFIQDSSNNIYLINNQGRILWKRQVKGQITGDVSQVDVYRNGKLQLAFSTSQYLYVVDRNGKNVAGFPVELPANATNPLAVVDYDSNRNYRFFQACADKGVYLFDAKGKRVPGWTFGKSETTVTAPVNFFRFAGKDYILIFDQNRPYIVNRKGIERVKPNDYFVRAANSSVATGTDSQGTPSFVTTDTLGLVRFIATSGRVESVALKTFTPMHTFIYTDIDGDGHNDYIVLDGQMLFAFNQQNKPIFTTKIAGNPEPKLMIFDFVNEKKIGLVDTKADNIYLINNNGNTEKTFPLQGNTPFSITKFNPKRDTYNLLVGTKQGALVNYEIR